MAKYHFFLLQTKIKIQLLFKILIKQFNKRAKNIKKIMNRKVKKLKIFHL